MSSFSKTQTIFFQKPLIVTGFRGIVILALFCFFLSSLARMIVVTVHELGHFIMADFQGANVTTIFVSPFTYSYVTSIIPNWAHIGWIRTMEIFFWIAFAGIIAQLIFGVLIAIIHLLIIKFRYEWGILRLLTAMIAMLSAIEATDYLIFGTTLKYGDPLAMIETMDTLGWFSESQLQTLLILLGVFFVLFPGLIYAYLLMNSLKAYWPISYPFGEVLTLLFLTFPFLIIRFFVSWLLLETDQNIYITTSFYRLVLYSIVFGFWIICLRSFSTIIFQKEYIWSFTGFFLSFLGLFVGLILISPDEEILFGLSLFYWIILLIIWDLKARNFLSWKVLKENISLTKIKTQFSFPISLKEHEKFENILLWGDFIIVMLLAIAGVVLMFLFFGISPPDQL